MRVGCSTERKIPATIGDAGEEKKSRRQPVPEKKESAEGRDDRLNVQDDVDHRRVPVFQREGEEDRADGGAGESGEDQEPQLRSSIFGISPSRDKRIGRNMNRMRTCSQKTITSASKRLFNGIRHALSVPHSAAPSPTSQGP